MNPHFFPDQKDFRKWLSKNYKKETELSVGFYKVGSGNPSMTWPQSVDEALCYGWIDGVRKSLGDESYTIRFTPRKPTSIWSAINIKKVEVLIKEGLMQPSGFEAFAKRSENKSKIYSYEKEASVLDATSEKKFKANKKAWKYFQSLAPSYKKRFIHYIMDAKQEKTKLSRLEKVIAASSEGKHAY